MDNFDLDTILNTTISVITTWGLRVLGAIFLLIIGRMIAKTVRRAVRRGLERGETDPTLIPFLSSMAFYLVIAFVLIAVLGMVGIQTASLVAVLGAAGLAVGLALQGTMANFAAGIMLLVFRPFQKGDFIEAAGMAGTVEAISIFSTRLNTPDNIAIVIPNGSVWGQTIKNYAVNPTRRVDMKIGIAYHDDIQLAVDTINRVLAAEPRVLDDPAPVVALHELGDSSVNLVVRPWCKREDYWNLFWYLNRTLKSELEGAGCSIPFPQRDIHLFQANTSAA